MPGVPLYLSTYPSIHLCIYLYSRSVAKASSNQPGNQRAIESSSIGGIGAGKRNRNSQGSRIIVWWSLVVLAGLPGIVSTSYVAGPTIAGAIHRRLHRGHGVSLTRLSHNYCEQVVHFFAAAQHDETTEWSQHIHHRVQCNEDAIHWHGFSSIAAAAAQASPSSSSERVHTYIEIIAKVKELSR